MTETTWEMHWGAPEKVQMITNCAVHKHQNWVPGNVHHIWPIGLGGPNTPENKVEVCMNGHGEIHAYLDLLIHTDDKISVSTGMHFGPKVRQLAYRGWVEAGKPTRGGGE